MTGRPPDLESESWSVSGSGGGGARALGPIMLIGAEGCTVPVGLVIAVSAVRMDRPNRVGSISSGLYAPVPKHQ